MNKTALKILEALLSNSIDSPSVAVNINELLELMPEKQRRCYTTIYRNLQLLVELKYVQSGFPDALSVTYYLTANGKSFCEANAREV